MPRTTMTNGDIESRPVTAEQLQPRESSTSQKPAKGYKRHLPKCLPILQFFGGGIYAPDPSTYDPIEILLNADSEDERDELTMRWRDNKLSELNFVGVVVCNFNGLNQCSTFLHHKHE